MKKNYKYLLLGIISISSLLLISVIPLIVNNNDATKNLSLRNDQLEKEKKTNPINKSPLSLLPDWILSVFLIHFVNPDRIPLGILALYAHGLLIEFFCTI